MEYVTNNIFSKYFVETSTTLFQGNFVFDSEISEKNIIDVISVENMYASIDN